MPLELEVRAEERRVVEPLASYVRGKRQERRSDRDRKRKKRDGAAPGPWPPLIKAEGDRQQRQDHKQIPLLEAVRAVAGVHRSLDHQPECERDDEERERALSPVAAAAKADHCSRDHRHPAGEREEE